MDEVVLHFVRPLEAHFGRHGYGFKEEKFKLTGNISALDGGADAPDETVFAMIHSYFEVEAHNQLPIDGAVSGLNRLSEHADILFLTNMPFKYRDARIKCLAGHELHYPVVTNTGPKGPALAHIEEQSPGPIWFLDDSPEHLHSVADTAPNVNLVHFVADPMFLELADDVPSAHLRTRFWDEAHTLITSFLTRIDAQ